MRASFRGTIEFEESDKNTCKSYSEINGIRKPSYFNAHDKTYAEIVRSRSFTLEGFAEHLVTSRDFSKLAFFGGERVLRVRKKGIEDSRDLIIQNILEQPGLVTYGQTLKTDSRRDDIWFRHINEEVVPIACRIPWNQFGMYDLAEVNPKTHLLIAVRKPFEG